MGTNYTGSPTSTQTPASPPGPQVLPTWVVPTDGDNDNAATWGQWARASADYVAWLMDPFCPAGNLKPLERFRNARLQARTGFNRRGFAAGRVLRFQEDWIGFDTVTTTGTAQSKLPRWTYNVSGSVLTNPIHTAPPGSSFTDNPLAPSLLIFPPGGAINGISEVYSTLGHLTATVDADAVLDVELTNGSSGDPTATFIAGIVDTGGTALGAIANGAWFQKTHGTANWFAFTGDGLGTTSVDTGVAFAGGVPHRGTIEFTGANAADGSANIARFFIDGVHITDITTHMPMASTPVLGVRMGAIYTSGTPGATPFTIGPLQYAQATIAGDTIF